MEVTRPSIEVSFTLVPDDLRGLERIGRKGRVGFNLHVMLMLVLVVVLGSFAVGVVTGMYRLNRPGVLRAVVVSHGVPLAAMAVVGFCLRPNYARVAAKIPGFSEPRTVRLTADALEHEDATGERRSRWRAVKEIVRDAEATYVVFDGDTALVVPDRAFRSSQEAQAFCEAARTFWESARGRQAT